MRLYQGEDQRNRYRRQQIGKQCIGSQRGCAAAQLTGNDGRSRSRRTNQTDHRAFEHFAVGLVHRTADQQSRYHQAGKCLEQKQPAMPRFRFQFVPLLYLAESKQELDKYQQGGNICNQLINIGFGGR